MKNPHYCTGIPHAFVVLREGLTNPTLLLPRKVRRENKTCPRLLAPWQLLLLLFPFRFSFAADLLSLPSMSVISAGS